MDIRFTPPETPKQVTQDPSESGAPDAYLWLECENRKVVAWVEKQNEAAESFLAALPEKKVLLEEIAVYRKIDDVYAPVPCGDLLFFKHRFADEQMPALFCCLRNAYGTPRAWKRLGPTPGMTLGQWAASPDGAYVAMHLSPGGEEWGQIKVVQVADAVILSESLAHTRWPSLAWLPDSSGFFYTRYPDIGTVPNGEEYLHCRAQFHRLKTAQSEDRVVVLEDRAATDSLNLATSEDGRWLAITVWKSFARTSIFISDLRTKGKPALILDGDSLSEVFFAHDLLYARTNLDAERCRLIATDPSKPAHPDGTGWETIIAENEDILELASPTRDGILLQYVHDAAQVLAYSPRGNGAVRSIELLEPGMVMVGTDRRSSEAYYCATSFVRPFTAYIYSPESSTSRAIATPATVFDPSDYVTLYREYLSVDGTLVPVHIVTRADTLAQHRPHPTLLSVYGCHGVSELPSYGAGRMAFLNRGGVFAQAAIRGGGERGPAWHAAGMLRQKHHSFEDTEAVAQGLIAEGLAKRDEIALWGSSNGAITVGAVLNRARIRFAAAVCEAPTFDMLRFHRFYVGKYWIEEFGNPDNPADADYLRQYSPYHGVRNDSKYPPVYLRTSAGDRRVHPMHARKMAAALQAASAAPVLLRHEQAGGHMADDAGVDARVTVLAEIYAFLFFVLHMHAARKS